MVSVSGSGGYPVPGARIGRFRIVAQLGQGGMGVVYRAVEENLGREVALKIVAPLYAHDPEFRERFTREARAQASLESAHVVAVYAHGEEDGYLYIASQLVADGDLGHLIRTAGVPPLPDALSVIEQVASGLADAHDAGLVHRDIKPGNVLVRIRGAEVRAYLADFGIARRMDAAATRFGSGAVGTPSYMAPELHGGAEASPVTDVYSLGCLLWFALTGAPPYPGQSDYQVVAGHVNGPVPQLDAATPMAQAANRILRLALAKESSQRYQGATEMRADLQAALRLPLGLGDTRPPSPPPGAAPTAGRSRRWAVAGVVGALVAVSGGVAAAALVDGGGGGGGRGDGPTSPAPTSTDSFLAMSPDAMLLASEKEMKVLDTVRVRGQFPDDGQNVAIDMRITADGDCAGTMSFTGSGSARVLRTEGRTLVKPDAAFLADFGIDNASAFHDYLDGRWLEFSKDPDQFASVCDLDEFLERDGRDGATATAEGVVKVQDEDAVEVDLREGVNQETYYVRLAEPHYLLRINETAQAWFEYSEFDDEVVVELPPERQILMDSEIGQD